MVIFINGQEETVDLNTNVEGMITHFDFGLVGGIAVAINETVVPKSQWTSTLLQENDKVLIIKASQGG